MGRVARASPSEALFSGSSRVLTGVATLISLWTSRARPRLIAFIVATSFLPPLPASCDPTSEGAKAPIPAHLTIASEGARPPYNYWDGDKLAGFEIDLGADLCRRMAVTCSFVAQDWDSMIPGLLDRRYDAIMAAMEINEARKAQIAFSTPYVLMPSAILVQKSTDLTSDAPEALSGRRIGVEQGGPHQTFVEQVYKGARVRTYATLSEAILDLEVGRVDAAIGDKDAIVTFLETRRDARCCRILADIARDPSFFGAGIGVGLRKEDAALKAAFDKAIGESLTDGTFARISARYFDFPIYPVPVPRSN